jgi:hypothetical protein
MNPARFLSASLLMPALAAAGVSDNYSLTPETVDSGGLRGTSANYTLNASTSAGNASSSARYTARSGYAGQLSDASAISITASPSTVNEASTRQLSATLVFDDSTTSPLAAGSLTWSVQSGPLIGISPSGLATAAPVYQHSVAVARGSWLSFSATTTISILNILPDNFSTYAGDGLPDDWQVLYFGLNNPLAAPLLDPDGDSLNNRFEYHACLVPTDRLSTFSVSISPAPAGGHMVTFSPRLPGCTYTLLGSSNLSLWAPVTGTITDVGNTRTILDPASTAPSRFYSIQVQRQQ